MPSLQRPRGSNPRRHLMVLISTRNITRASRLIPGTPLAQHLCSLRHPPRGKLPKFQLQTRLARPVIPTQQGTSLRGPDFLNAKEFPNVSFKSKSVKPADGGSRFEVAGDLTLHGQTKPVTVTLEKIGTGGNRIGFEGVMEIRRSDFGIRGVQGVADEVRLIIAFEGVKK